MLTVKYSSYLSIWTKRPKLILIIWLLSGSSRLSHVGNLFRYLKYPSDYDGFKRSYSGYLECFHWVYIPLVEPKPHTAPEENVLVKPWLYLSVSPEHISKILIEWYRSYQERRRLIAYLSCADKKKETDEAGIMESLWARIVEDTKWKTTVWGYTWWMK